jgi:hypothetical protein
VRQPLHNLWFRLQVVHSAICMLHDDKDLRLSEDFCLALRAKTWLSILHYFGLFSDQTAASMFGICEKTLTCTDLSFSQRNGGQIWFHICPSMMQYATEEALQQVGGSLYVGKVQVSACGKLKHGPARAVPDEEPLQTAGTKQESRAEPNGGSAQTTLEIF